MMFARDPLSRWNMQRKEQPKSLDGVRGLSVHVCTSTGHSVHIYRDQGCLMIPCLSPRWMKAPKEPREQYPRVPELTSKLKKIPRGKSPHTIYIYTPRFQSSTAHSTLEFYRGLPEMRADEAIHGRISLATYLEQAVSGPAKINKPGF